MQNSQLLQFFITVTILYPSMIAAKGIALQAAYHLSHQSFISSFRSKNGWKYPPQTFCST